MESNVNYVVITDRKECWQGLEQDITNRISIGSTYTVSACVGVSGLSQRSSDVIATLKLEYHDSATRYLFIGRYMILRFRCIFFLALKKLRKMPFTCLPLFFYRTSVNKDSWEKLEGTFSLSTMPHRVIFYLEGPAPGVDLLIRSVEINCSTPNNSVSQYVTKLCILSNVISLCNSTYWQSLILFDKYQTHDCAIAITSSMVRLKLQ